MEKKTALVVGGNGTVGRNLCQYLEHQNDWEVIVTSRSALDYKSDSTFIALDLTDPLTIKQESDALKKVTHVFFSAYLEGQTLAEETLRNELALKNLVVELEASAPDLKRIVFIQGGKAYGAHLGKYKTPAKETAPRHFPPNFYYSQEDYLRFQSEGKQWSWTAIRPDIVTGIAIGNPMNIVNVIAIYASFCQELNVPFRFPGSDEAYHALINVTGADVLAKAMVWAGEEEQCRDEIFNITNGDLFRWSDAWPQIARFFELELAEPLTFSLHEFMADKELLWTEMLLKHGLVHHPLHELVQWPFGDFIFSVKHDAFFDVNKARRAGFQEMNLDSVQHMLRIFQTLRDQKIIP